MEEKIIIVRIFYIISSDEGGWGQVQLWLQHPKKEIFERLQ